MKQIVALSKASFWELVRNPFLTGMTALFPLAFLIMYLLMPDFTLPDGSTVRALAYGLPLILVFAILSLGLTGTGAPMTELRQQRVLRSLGMTPVTRSQFLWAQLPARIVVILAVLVLIVVIAALTGTMDLKSPLLLLWATVLCTAATLSLGLLLGATTAKVGLMSAAGGLLGPALLLLCGLWFPLAFFPDYMEFIASWFPFTYVGDMMRHGLIGTPLQYPVLLGSAVSIIWTAVMGVLAGRLFTWDNSKA